MRTKIMAAAVAAAALLATSVAQPAVAKKDPVFVDGGVLAGSTNGISFGPNGTLFVANVFGATITEIDPESGAVLSRLTAADGVGFPDDVVVASNGDIYWTDIAFGAIFKKPDGLPAFPLVPPGGLNSANPLTLSEDEDRLFAAGCYGGPPALNSFVEIDLDTGDLINTYREGIVGCASNGMSWYDGYLYSPQPFEDRILRIDPDSGDITVVTEDWPVPIGTAFDSEGNLYSLAQGVGEVVRIDIDGDPTSNREVVATIPFAWADNIAINDEDRVFISSATDSSIHEVMLDTARLREVVPGKFQLAAGVNVIGDTVYATHPAGIVGFDRKTGTQTSHYRTPAGVGDLPFVLSSAVWGENLVLMSAFGGEILLWDPVANVALAKSFLPGPVDAQVFQGDLIVTTVFGGNIFRLDENLAVVGVVGNVPGATGLAAKDGDLYVADPVNGAILRIIADGAVLAQPVTAFTGLDFPEGLDIRNNRMYVVESGSEKLTSIHLQSGKRKTIATNLGLQEAALPDFFTYGFINNVTVSVNNEIFVNADRRNVIYEF